MGTAVLRAAAKGKSIEIGTDPGAHAPGSVSVSKKSENTVSLRTSPQAGVAIPEIEGKRIGF